MKPAAPSGTRGDACGDDPRTRGALALWNVRNVSDVLLHTMRLCVLPKESAACTLLAEDVLPSLWIAERAIPRLDAFIVRQASAGKFKGLSMSQDRSSSDQPTRQLPSSFPEN
jgi:hypothetical protein